MAQLAAGGRREYPRVGIALTLDDVSHFLNHLVVSALSLTEYKVSGAAPTLTSVPCHTCPG